MNILFRADSSSKIGIGHIMRDLVLAKSYEKKDNNIFFACRNLEGNISNKILENGFSLEIIKSNKKEELISLIKKYKIDLLVIDNYDINWKYEKSIKEKTKVKILSLDDTYEKHHCDILLNHNISAKENKYKNLVPKSCKIKCGTKYSLIRDEFYKERKKKKEKSKTKKIFIAMGGADHKNLNQDILKVVKNFKNLKVNLVTTNANKNLEELIKYCKNKPWIKLHINSNKIAKIMRKSDFAIITPSVTVNEVIFMDIPFITIKTADNQNDIYKYLYKKKYNVLKSFNKKKLQKKIYKVLKEK